MKKPKKKQVLATIGVVAALVAIYFVYETLMYVKTDNAQVEAHSVMLAPKVGGYVVDVRVTEGQRVKKDEILIQLDERDYQNAANQAKAELTSLEARRRDAERNFKRLSDLVAKGAISQQQFDTGQATYTETRSKYDSLAAQFAQAELNLENTRIKAPSDGHIARRSVERGQLASPGVPLLGFVSAEERWVTANFKETEVASVKVGKEVDIEIDAISRRNYRGKVESISSATGATFTLLPPDNATGNFTKVVQRVPVKIALEGITPEDIDLLRAGLSAVVKVHIH